MCCRENQDCDEQLAELDALDEEEDMEEESMYEAKKSKHEKAESAKKLLYLNFAFPSGPKPSEYLSLIEPFTSLLITGIFLHSFFL